MDRRLNTGNIEKKSEKEISAADDVAPGLACDKPNFCGEVKWRRKVVHQERKV
jgi:hypothetical protein